MARRALGPAGLAVVQAVDSAVDSAMLVACSGGPDSLALAAAAALVGRRRNLPVRAIVVDHGLQSGSPQVAAHTCAQLKDRLELAATVTAVRVTATGMGPEADARQARYDALRAAVRQGEAVLLGHTLDDQAETVLLGLARGSGTRSLSGMPARRDNMVRPLLGLRRTTTEQACEEFGLLPWRDPHNECDEFARVRVRHRVLPVVETELGPGIAEALARSAALLRADADFLDELADDEWAGFDHDTLDCQRLNQLPGALRSRIVRRWLLDSGSPAPTLRHCEAVLALVSDWHGQRWVDLPGVRVSRVDGQLVCHRSAYPQPH